MYDEMSPEQIAEHIAENKARVAALELAMESKREIVADALLTHVRNQAALYGLDLAKISAALSPVATVEKPKRTRKPAEPGSAKVYVLLTDETRTYSRGKMPVWLHEEMRAAGFDPEVKGDRERFKAENMRLAA